MARASMSRHTPQVFPALTEFREKLLHFNLQPLKESENAPLGPAFVRTPQLRDWFSSETREGDVKVENIERLLGDAFQQRHGRNATLPPYSTREVLRSCSLVFSMLLEADMGHLIDAVIRQQITDRNLCDISEKDLAGRLRTVLEADDSGDHEERCRRHTRLFGLLSKRRWAYFPHVFEFNTIRELNASIILPIYKQQRIDRQKGGTASIHQLCIPEEYLDAPMREHLKGSSFYLEGVGTCYYLAVKTFTESEDLTNSTKRLYDKECEAYRHIESHGGMVQYLGAYSHRKPNGLAEHNILLEYGDYDLAEYFLFSPPVLPSNVCNLWHNLFDVASALSGLHKFGRTQRGMIEEYWGWHADIKPDNILSVKGQLKLADPGFAGFAKLVKGQDAPRTRIIAMTSTYGPPECHLSDRETETPQAADMWSLGCVLSEAATWLILGPPGLAQYTALRKVAIRRASETRKHVTLDPSIITWNTGECDYFHDGYAVLPEVRQWHQYLKSNLRRGDEISEEVLAIIDDKLLQKKPQDRYPNAGKLCIELDKIRKRYPREKKSGLPSAIDEVVRDVESRLKSQPTDSIWGQSDSIQSRKALKTKDHLELPRDRVAHLSNMIKYRIEGAESRPQLSLNPIHDSRRSSDTALMASPTAVSSWEHPEIFGIPQPSPQQSFELTPSRTRPAEGLSTHKAESIFDAHYAKDVPKGRLRSWAGSIRTSGRKNKDALLAEHYDNRDIKFIVDNSSGMAPEWQKVRFVLEKIAKKASWVDEDGMDLQFVNHHNDFIKLKEKNMMGDIELAMEHHKPQPVTKTDMSAKLGRLLQDWLAKPHKSMTLIILTDGCWGGMEHTRDVEDVIVRFDGLIKKRILTKRHVSIQFISFGDDSDALYRLRHLDDDLVLERNIDDIVDTEHWTGDVYKMLLGSLVPNIDLLNEEPDRSDSAPSVMHRQEITWPSTHHDQHYSQHPHTHQERHLSHPAQPQTQIFSTAHNQRPSQSSHYSRRELAHKRQTSTEPIDHYRYPS